eukprot:SM000010S04236  [mRNA]  locus=s10:462921:469128:+ [translate_table: standard]
MKSRCLLLATLLAVMAAQGLADPGSTLINCGGPDFTDVAPYARNWTADSNYSGISEKTVVSNITNLVFAGLELYQTAKYTDASVPLSVLPHSIPPHLMPEASCLIIAASPLAPRVNLMSSIFTYLVISKSKLPQSDSSQAPLTCACLQYAIFTDFDLQTSTFLRSITEDRYFIRLHFAAIQPQSGAFPDPSKALLTHESGSYITMPLLSYYNVTQQASAQEFSLPLGVHIVRNGLLVTSSQMLNITFTPIADSFAFVNGIELVPSDKDLYNQQPRLASNHRRTKEISGKPLKREYRLNCGGLSVSSTSDKLYRTWTKNDADFLDPLPDIVFLEGGIGGAIPLPQLGRQIGAANMTANRSTTTSRDHNTTLPQHLIVTTPIRNTDAPPYYTPLAVAQSDRSFPALDASQLTYRFPLDDGWHYLVRIIFSENVYSLPNQRVMNVFLDKVFVGEFDIAKLAGKNSVYVRDFVVSLPVGQSSMRLDIRISNNAPAPGSPALHPAAPPHTSFAPSIPSANPPAETPASPTRTSPPPAGTPAPPKGPQGKSSSSAAVIGGAIGGVAVALILATLSYYCCIRKRKQDKHSLSELSKPSTSRRTPPSFPGKGHKTLPETGKQIGREFLLQELVLATNDFADDLLLGVGGFGKVFKGVLEDGTKVAVKRCSPDSRQGIVEFHTEIKLLSQLRHRHLVSLIGYCEEGLEKLLVYDFMSNGVLRSHLYGTDAVLHNVLSWKQRLEICIGAARGLHYLHTGAAQSIIHRDIKSTNILLDDNFVAKVADFGLSRIGPGLGNPNVSTVVAGSVGYLDPEYLCSLLLNEKSDVYSFGVVLLEVICARAPINTEISDQLTLVKSVQNLMKHKMLDQMPDTKMAGTYQWASMKKVVELALKCVSYDSSNRPPMSDVLWNLESALLLQEADSAGNESEPTIIVRQDGMWPKFQDDRSTYIQVSYGSVPGRRDPVSVDNSRVSLEDVSVILHGR